jgi:hypothetical protein
MMILVLPCERRNRVGEGGAVVGRGGGEDVD